MQLPVSGREVVILEQKELDLPEAGVVDLEKVGLGPILAVGQQDVERRPPRAVNLDGFIISRRGV